MSRCNWPGPLGLNLLPAGCRCECSVDALQETESDVKLDTWLSLLRHSHYGDKDGRAVPGHPSDLRRVGCVTRKFQFPVLPQPRLAWPLFPGHGLVPRQGGLFDVPWRESQSRDQSPFFLATALQGLFTLGGNPDFLFWVPSPTSATYLPEATKFGVGVELESRSHLCSPLLHRAPGPFIHDFTVQGPCAKRHSV